MSVPSFSALIANMDIVPESGCWEWNRNRSKEGYGKLCVARRYWRAHRLMWTLVNGDIKAGLNVLHRCDNPSCINPLHLFLGTTIDNANDRVAKGRSASGNRNGARLHPDHLARGESQGLVRLTAVQVIEIRARFERKETTREIATTFGICQATVSQIVSGKTWKHI